MQVSLSWLNQYVPVSLPVSEIADALTMAGLEVDGVFDRFAYLDGAVVGKVISVDAHPDADHLTVCRVDAGDGEVAVVCGAPNVKKDMLTALVRPGFVLPNGMTIKKSKIRGVVSRGMLCSAVELAVGPDSDGIMEIQQAVNPGTPLAEALSLSDWVLEIDLTPNRPDCLSIIGVAREVAGFTGQKLTLPEFELPEGVDNISDYSSVEIKDPELCTRYVARVVLDIKVAESPFWLKDRLLSVGLKPINNIVDITNFVMMETGQPLHAFDLDRLAENRIVVQRAGSVSSFVTLDEKERPLSSDMLMICDAQKPVAVGGVMGGMNSEITEQTTRVLLESACFNPTSIRKTAKLLGLGSDAAHRFERGVDPLGTLLAADRATQLMVEIAGGTMAKGVIDNHPRPAEEKNITVSVDAINRRLGTGLNINEMSDLLGSVGFGVDKTDDDLMSITVPSFRVDVERPEDISEEVARLWGYNKIPVTFPVISGDSGNPALMFDWRQRFRGAMRGFGFSEIVSYAFISETACERMDVLNTAGPVEPINILNPLAADQSVMRTSLIPGLLSTMRHNLSQQISDMKLFETGRVFWKNNADEDLPEEPEMITALMAGAVRRKSWHLPEEPCDFFDIKGALESLLKELGAPTCGFTAMPKERCLITRPGYTARVDVSGVEVGMVGEVAAGLLEKFDLKKPAFVFELNMSAVVPLLSDLLEAGRLSRFPSVSRDITVIVDLTVEAQRILNFLEEDGGNLIENIEVLDVYEGGNIPAGKKSLSFRVVYRSQDATLKDKFVNRIHSEIAGRLIEAFSAQLPA